MENYIIERIVSSVSKDLATADANFSLIAKSLRKLTRATKKNANAIFMTNVLILCIGGILYIQDKQIAKLEEDVEQLKSGETTEVKAE